MRAFSNFVNAPLQKSDGFRSVMGLPVKNSNYFQNKILRPLRRDVFQRNELRVNSLQQAQADACALALRIGDRSGLAGGRRDAMTGVNFVFGTSAISPTTGTVARTGGLAITPGSTPRRGIDADPTESWHLWYLRRDGLPPEGTAQRGCLAGDYVINRRRADTSPKRRFWCCAVFAARRSEPSPPALQAGFSGIRRRGGVSPRIPRVAPWAVARRPYRPRDTNLRPEGPVDHSPGRIPGKAAMRVTLTGLMGRRGAAQGESLGPWPCGRSFPA
jgi:hypothetical protein